MSITVADVGGFDLPPGVPVALVAGMLAALNPCGFALLPAYLTLLVAQGPDLEPDSVGAADTRMAALGRAARLSAAMTVGFVAVFGAFAILVVPLALSVERFLPWATVIIGVLLLVMGVLLLAGREFSITTPRLSGGAPDRSLRSMVAYGVVYAVASLSCTVGPFLAVTTTTFRSGTLTAGLLVFAAYALGMGLVIGIFAAAAALARTSIIHRARQLLPYISRISGALLLVAGAYVTYYGWYEVRVLRGADPDDPIVGAALTVQGFLAQRVDQLGPWGVFAILAAIATFVVGSAAIARKRRVSEPH